MTNEQKNKWIVENILNECWHVDEYYDTDYSSPDWETIFICGKCKREICTSDQYVYYEEGKTVSFNFDFYISSPDKQAINFFKLWNAIKEKKWFYSRDEGVIANIYEDSYGYDGIVALISCSILADAVGNYFKWEVVDEPDKAR